MSDRVFASTIHGAAHAPREAIAHAARRTGVEFDYLLAQAEIESGMDPRAEARTSSASGLFQFIEQTWLATLDKHGTAFGYGKMANAIETRGGIARIVDPAMRNEILNLRFDPQAASLMAGALATDNRAALSEVLGRNPDASEMYLAHFLGSGGAERFLSKLATNPDHSAVALLPRAAAANRAIFRTPSGAERSVGEVMGVVRARVESAMARTGSPSDNFGMHAALAPSSRGYPAPFAYGPVPSGSPGSPQFQSMAATLRESFALAGEGAESPRLAHIRQAYSRLEAFGL